MFSSISSRTSSRLSRKSDRIGTDENVRPTSTPLRSMLTTPTDKNGIEKRLITNSDDKIPFPDLDET